MTNEITKERRDAIRAAAEMAAQKPWDAWERGYAENVGHINPQTILALLDALDAAEAERDTLRADHAVMANYVRPLIPPGENPDQATNVYAWVGMLAEARKRADAAEAKMGEPVAWQHHGPRGGWITTDEKTKWSERALYAAPPAAEPVIPEGWVLVPREPTEAMYEGGWNAMFQGQWKGTEAALLGAGWDAMLAAAPALVFEKEAE